MYITNKYTFLSPPLYSNNRPNTLLLLPHLPFPPHLIKDIFLFYYPNNLPILIIDKILHYQILTKTIHNSIQKNVLKFYPAIQRFLQTEIFPRIRHFLKLFHQIPFKTILPSLSNNRALCILLSKNLLLHFQNTDTNFRSQ